MKVLFVALFVVVGAFARSAVQQQDIFAEGPRCPIRDPLTNESAPLNVTFHPILELSINSVVRNLIVEGLSTLKYTININAILLTATFDVTLERVTGNGTFDADGYIDVRPLRPETIPSGNLTASNEFAKISGSGLEVKGRAALFVNLIGNKVQIRTLELEKVAFASASLDFGGLEVGGKKHDWAQISAGFKANFDADFNTHKTAITEKIRGAANEIVGRYTLQELIELIGDGSGEQKPCPETK